MLLELPWTTEPLSARADRLRQWVLFPFRWLAILFGKFGFRVK